MNLENKLIAHRGYYNAIIPENSLESFKKCIDLKIPIELDVHLTKDHQIVVFHDFYLKRMTGKEEWIENMTLEEIQKLYLKNSKATIPTLKEVLNLVNSKVSIIIELKNNKIGPLEKTLFPLLDNYSNFYIQSFKAKSLRYIKKKRPSYQVGLILFTYRFLLYRKFDFINCSTLGIINNKIQKLRSKKKILIWNIKNQKEYEKFKKYGDFYLVDIKNFI